VAAFGTVYLDLGAHPDHAQSAFTMTTFALAALSLVAALLIQWGVQPPKQRPEAEGPPARQATGVS
jgi:hypothetical protein